MIWGAVISLSPARVKAFDTSKEYEVDHLPEQFRCGYLHASNTRVLFEVQGDKAINLHVPPHRLITCKISAVYHFDHLKRDEIKEIIDRHLHKAEQAIRDELNARTHAVTFKAIVGKERPPTSHYPIKYSMRFHPQVVAETVARIAYLSRAEKRLLQRIQEMRQERLDKTEFLDETNRLQEGHGRTKLSPQNQ